MQALATRRLVGSCAARRLLPRSLRRGAPAAAATATTAVLRMLQRSHSDTPASNTPPPAAPTASRASPPPHSPPPAAVPHAAADNADDGDGDAATTQHELPGVALARRVVQPSATYAASLSNDEPLDPHDPRIEWRELYSLEYQRPYYHNVRTDEVTYHIPDGFVTRFARYYRRRRDCTVDERGAVWRTSATTPPQPSAASDDSDATSPTRPLTMRQKLATYGAGGLLWYLVIHNVSLACVFTCMYVFRINLVEVARSYGVRIGKTTAAPQASSAANDDDGVARHSATRRRPPLWRTLLESFVLNKMLVPAHLLLTVATAPLIMHRLTPIAVALTPWCRRLVHRLRSAVRPPTTSPSA